MAHRRARAATSQKRRGRLGNLAKTSDSSAGRDCRGFLRRLFGEGNPAGRAFRGTAWLFLGVANRCSGRARGTSKSKHIVDTMPCGARRKVLTPGRAWFVCLCTIPTRQQGFAPLRRGDTGACARRTVDLPHAPAFASFYRGVKPDHIRVEAN